MPTSEFQKAGACSNQAAARQVSGVPIDRAATKVEHPTGKFKKRAAMLLVFHGARRNIRPTALSVPFPQPEGAATIQRHRPSPYIRGIARSKPGSPQKIAVHRLSRVEF